LVQIGPKVGSKALNHSDRELPFIVISDARKLIMNRQIGVGESKNGVSRFLATPVFPRRLSSVFF